MKDTTSIILIALVVIISGIVMSAGEYEFGIYTMLVAILATMIARK